jgi:hypothetical protein
LAPQLGIIAAGIIEKRSASFRRSLQRSMEEIFGSPPDFLLHGRLSALSKSILLPSPLNVHAIRVTSIAAGAPRIGAHHSGSQEISPTASTKHHDLPLLPANRLL